MAKKRILPETALLNEESQSRKILRVTFVLFILILISGLSLIGNSSANKTVAPSAVQPTSSSEIAQIKSLQIELPGNKAEAAAFEKLHHSPFNFGQTQSLNASISDSSSYSEQTSKILQGGDTNTPSVSNPNAGRAKNDLSAPTKVGYSQGLVENATPAPTSKNEILKPNVTGNPTCFTAPNPDVPDSCEPDNSSDLATLIIVNDAAQLHNFVISGTTTPNPSNDVDWLRFDATANVPYTITVQLRTGTIVPSLVLLDPKTSTILAAGKVSGSSSVISNFVPSSSNTYYIRILSQNNSPNDVYALTLVNGPALPSPTATSLSSTATASATPLPCRDSYEDDNSPDNAKVLKPSSTDQLPLSGTPGAPPVSAENSGVQVHTICPTGDLDWVYMDLVKGKPYSVFTSNLSGGLDTFMVLYSRDAAGNLNPLYSSDDYPGMGMASRIDWIVPNTKDTPLGTFVRYYLAVKDVASHGDPTLKYNLTLSSPGNGLGDCFDAYEPDNSPDQAKEILLNETQTHAFCPTGDRDWVRFYAKAGRTYNVGTFFPSGSTGLDTSLFIWSISFDPNSPSKVVNQTLLSSNDDRSDLDLSSSATFSVPSDGYYFAEFRNTGDLGRNGLYYTVRFSTAAGSAVDVPGTKTASAATASARATGTALSGTAAARTPTPTRTSASTSAQTTGFIELDSLLANMRFSEPGFQQIWVYSDLPVAAGKTQRSWEWGPKVISSKLESYNEAPGSVRQVQYFDKARMEINNPKGERSSKWFVTNGLLVKELVSGWLVTGDTNSELHQASNIAIAGDLDPSNNAPAYSSFQKLITQNNSNMAEDRTGQVVSAFLYKDGSISNLAVPVEPIKFNTYIKETGHNIPAVFWSYMNVNGQIFNGTDFVQGPVRDWIFSMGLPLSEPYWIKALVGGVEKDVMVQLFERRVLTYTPSNSPEWRVEMANVGQHYYLWRYNSLSGD